MPIGGGMEQSGGQNLSVHARDAGIGDDNRGVGIAEETGNDLGRLSQSHALPREMGLVVGVEQFYIPLGGGENEDRFLTVEREGGVL